MHYCDCCDTLSLCLTGNRAPKPLPPMAPTVGKAPLHNFAVFVDEENGPGKLAGHLEDPTPSGGWGSLGTEKERRKENQGE